MDLMPQEKAHIPSSLFSLALSLFFLFDFALYVCPHLSSISYVLFSYETA